MSFTSLASVADVIRGVSFSKAEGASAPSIQSLPIIRAGSIQDQLLLCKDQIWVPKEKVQQRQKIRCNDIIMCTSSGSANLVGKCAISNVDFEGSFGAFCVGIRPNPEKVSPSYLFHFLSSPSFRNWTKNSSGANIKNIRVSELAEFKIPLPSLSEQKHVADILDKISVIRRRRQQSIEFADEFLRATFLDMFGDPIVNPKGWKTDSLTSFGSFKNGLNFSKSETGVQVKCLGVGDFGSLSKILDNSCLSVIDLNDYPSKEYFLHDGDLVFVRSNGNKQLVGRCVVVYPGDEKTTFSGFCIRYRLESSDIEPVYLSHLFRVGSFRRIMLQNGQGANIQNISQSTLMRLQIPIPSIDVQCKFATIVDSVERQQANINKHLAKINYLFSALLQRAFKGKL